MKKKILLIVLAILVIIQFIRPARNESNTMSANDITKHFTVPDDVNAILKKACNDCHSNNTIYPWYMNVQPVGWWMADHVKDGKKELNFSEFGSYAPKRQHHKLEEVIDQVKEGEMPLDSYTWMHKEAILTTAEKTLLMNWAEILRKEIAEKNNLPAEEEKKPEKK
jgi:heme-binding protein